jgi:aspartokinase-like uncharacterized kinase
VVTGLGAFIAERAARQAGLDVISLASALGHDAAKCAPAASVALLFGLPQGDPWVAPTKTVNTVVKIGGGLLAYDGCLDRVLTTIADMAHDEPVLIVPGGGPFADAVRDQDERLHITDDAAHWMAVLAMDQYAHLIVSRLRGAVLVTSGDGVSTAVDAGRIPVLAPFAWLHRTDPVPHSWQVTSDSIAAWVANTIGARRLVLIKPPGVNPHTAEVVDGYVDNLRADLAIDVIGADAIETLRQVTRP